ncbi:MAG TPA: histidine kinase [Streptosporangiaceae bacterium]|jgi:signal transduction histidine kinase|nr:histidine kinase [Streptosporangiaceae bacterium]
MPELRRFALSWRSDLLLAAIVVGWVLVYLSLIARTGDQHWMVLVFALPYAAALGVRRRWPVPAAAVACAALAVVWPLGLAPVVNGALSIPFFLTPFLFAYSLGADAGLAVGLAGSVLLAVCLQLSNAGVFNPLGEMLTVGPWLVGRVVLSRRKLTQQLQARNEELRAEQELFALESVRYERARIARELHDIVAHCLSVMVVQASAGQRMAPGDRDGVTGALESVAEAAAQAQTEVGRLVELLSGDPSAAPPPGLAMVDELVRRASGSGLAVSCRFAGSCDRLAPAASEAAYRVVQEALTNALKHAPGAPVDITVRSQGAEVAVDVVNAPGRQQPSGLERSGSGFGLAGMRDRVAACGGSLTCGPTQAGGWRVSALLPVAPAAVLRADGVRTNSGVSVPAKPAGSGRMKQGPLHV